MTKEVRDDSRLFSLICPHCKMNLCMESPDLRCVSVFKRYKLVSLKCPHCEGLILEDQIDNTYREYITDDMLDESVLEAGEDDLEDEWDDGFDDDDLWEDEEDEEEVDS